MAYNGRYSIAIRILLLKKYLEASKDIFKGFACLFRKVDF